VSEVRDLAVAVSVGLLLALSLPASAEAKPQVPAGPPAEMVAIPAGVYRPLLPISPAEAEVAVAAFWLDRVPVTNADFLRFVEATPAWRRDRVGRLRADGRYLEHWAAPDRLGPEVIADAPATNVSWFAARAYCASRGKRLPIEREWERSAVDLDATPAAREAARAQVLAWMLTPGKRSLRAVGQRAANHLGVHDLNEVVWEWVDDYGAALVPLDDRNRGDDDRQKFCGAGAAKASDPTDYAAFMRMAMRSALSASDASGMLGFRCAKDAPS